MAMTKNKRDFKLWFDVVLHTSADDEREGRGVLLSRAYNFGDAQYSWAQRGLSGLPANAYSIGLVEGGRPRGGLRSIAARRAA